MSHTVYAFDAYGTLFDVHSAVQRHGAKVGQNPERVSEIWRNKQLEYSWTRASMGRYKSFWELTQDALDFALQAVPGANPKCRNDLLDAYMALDCYGEVQAVLANLQKNGAHTAVLSNGSPDMLNAAIKSAGIHDLLDASLSVDPVKTFKTMPATYRTVLDRFGVEADQVAFQSSNRWDIAGAKAFGFTCNWINRTGQPDEYHDLKPDRVFKDLNGLL